MHHKGPTHTQFHSGNYHDLCRALAKKDKDLEGIIDSHGYPPLWVRSPNFQTLILMILEQQVSLASAYAAFRRLKEQVGFVTPAKILQMTDKEMRACYFSRQKMLYARELASAIIKRNLNLRKLSSQPDEIIREELKKIKGIGDWTVDVYLMHALRRTDLFPLGDIALVNSLKEVKKLAPSVTRQELLDIADSWRPFRTIASMILWHAYIQKRGIIIQELR